MTERRVRQARYINQRALALLAFSYRGLIPACVIADALEEKARREGRPLPPSAERRQS